MKLKGKCEGCLQVKWFIRYRHYKIPGRNIPITSQSLLCGKCAKNVKLMLGK